MSKPDRQKLYNKITPAAGLDLLSAVFSSYDYLTRSGDTPREGSDYKATPSEEAY